MYISESEKKNIKIGIYTNVCSYSTSSLPQILKDGKALYQI